MKVVLVHGLTASTQWWEGTIAALEPEHEAEIVRLPRLRIREAAAWLAERLERPDLRGAAVVGHSSGGTIAVLAAAQSPDSVDRLVLLAPAGLFDTRSPLAYVPRLAIQVLRAPQRLPQMVRDSLRVGPIRLLRVAVDLLDVDVAPALPRVRARTLVVWGADDPLLSAELGPIFAERIPDARLIVLPGCGHIPMLECPDGLNEQLRGFLA